MQCDGGYFDTHLGILCLSESSVISAYLLVNRLSSALSSDATCSSFKVL